MSAVRVGGSVGLGAFPRDGVGEAFGEADGVGEVEFVAKAGGVDGEVVADVAGEPEGWGHLGVRDDADLTAAGGGCDGAGEGFLGERGAVGEVVGLAGGFGAGGEESDGGAHVADVAAGGGPAGVGDAEGDGAGVAELLEVSGESALTVALAVDDG